MFSGCRQFLAANALVVGHPCRHSNRWKCRKPEESASDGNRSRSLGESKLDPYPFVNEKMVEKTAGLGTTSNARSPSGSPTSNGKLVPPGGVCGLATRPSHRGIFGLRGHERRGKRKLQRRGERTKGGQERIGSPSMSNTMQAVTEQFQQAAETFYERIQKRQMMCDIHDAYTRPQVPTTSASVAPSMRRRLTS